MIPFRGKQNTVAMATPYPLVSHLACCLGELALTVVKGGRRSYIKVTNTCVVSLLPLPPGGLDQVSLKRSSHGSQSHTVV